MQCLFIMEERIVYCGPRFTKAKISPSASGRHHSLHREGGPRGSGSADSGQRSGRVGAARGSGRRARPLPVQLEAGENARRRVAGDAPVCQRRGAAACGAAPSARGLRTGGPRPCGGHARGPSSR